MVGPSNPVLSIAPILDDPGDQRSARDSKAPTVAVSPLVAGEIVKGPTAVFMKWAGKPLTSAGIASYYEGVIAGLIADDPDAGDVPCSRPTC